MAARLDVYLSFAGNCEQAMKFYKECLGGELTIQKVGDSPMASQMPGQKDKIMHSVLKSGDMTIMASDMMDSQEAHAGNMTTLCINGGTVDDIRKCFTKLSAGGKITHALKEEFFGTYGDLTDKFGIRWMFQNDAKK